MPFLIYEWWYYLCNYNHSYNVSPHWYFKQYSTSELLFIPAQWCCITVTVVDFFFVHFCIFLTTNKCDHLFQSLITLEVNIWEMLLSIPISCFFLSHNNGLISPSPLFIIISVPILTIYSRQMSATTHRNHWLHRKYSAQQSYKCYWSCFSSTITMPVYNRHCWLLLFYVILLCFLLTDECDCLCCFGYCFLFTVCGWARTLIMITDYIWSNWVRNNISIIYL